MRRYSAQVQYPDPTKPPSGGVLDVNEDGDSTRKCKTTQSFETLFDSEALSDVVLNINEGELTFNAHKMILGMKSEVFTRLLNELTAVDDSPRLILKLHVDADCVQIFSRFLHFLYSGAVWLHREYVVPLYRLAVDYSVWPLISHCENYIMQILEKTIQYGYGTASFSIEVVSSLYESNIMPGQIRSQAFQVLCVCFTQLSCSKLWSSCSWEMVRDLIQSDDINADEDCILSAATGWMKDNKLQDKSKIQDILANIRYPVLNRRVLYHLLKNTAFQNFPYVAELVDGAVKYQCFKDFAEAHHEFTGIQYQRRKGQLPRSSQTVGTVPHQHIQSV